MSGEGRPVLVVPDARGLRVAIAVAQWHPEIIDGLLARALAVAGRGRAPPNPWSSRCRDRWSCPWSSPQLATDHDAVVALGVVIRGGTPHFEYVCEAVTYGLTRVSLDAGIAIGNGVLTVNTVEQAVDRAGGPGAAEDKGGEAMAAALTTAAHPAQPAGPGREDGILMTDRPTRSPGTDRGRRDHSTVRPRRIAIYAAIGAAAVVIVGEVFVALKLRSSDTGVIFRTSDALAMAGLGLLFAGGLMLTARPRLRADAAGLRVRNIVGERFVPWPVVERIAFPEGAVWAQLELADDEVMSVMAIQSMDKERAVVALHEVRALHDRYAPPTSRRAAAARCRPRTRTVRSGGWRSSTGRRRPRAGASAAGADDRTGASPTHRPADASDRPDLMEARVSAAGGGSRRGPARAGPEPRSTRGTPPAGRRGRPGTRRRAARGPAATRSAVRPVP